jgi:hypothetical protein
MRKLIIAGTLLTACVESTPKTDIDSGSSPRTNPVITSVRVNQGTYGMSAKVKWTYSPDSSGIIAMVDPSGAENDPVPNAFYYGSESRNFQARMDSVWDVAPSPDWSMIAFSRAYVLSAGGEDSIPSSTWQELARKTSIDTATLRTSSFAASGMSMARAIALPGTITVPADSRSAHASEDAAPRMYRNPVGWRIAWTRDTLVALGNSPARTVDSEQSESWASLDPRSGAFHSTLPADAKLVKSRWVVGPTLDVSTPVSLDAAPAIDVNVRSRKFAIETVRGVISAREISADSTAKTYTIGSGRVLAATKGGRYILALAPRAHLAPGETPVEAVVYVVGW